MPHAEKPIDIQPDDAQKRKGKCVTTTTSSATMCGVLYGGKSPQYPGEKLSANDGHTPAAVSSADIAWLVTHLQASVTASPTAWAGRGMTLLQIIALHIISAQAPATLNDIAQALGTGPPATSAMVDRLIRIGLVSRKSDPQDRRRVNLTITDHAKTMIGEIDLNTARRLQVALDHLGPQGRRNLIDVLRNTIRRSAGQSTTHH